MNPPTLAQLVTLAPLVAFMLAFLVLPRFRAGAAAVVILGGLVSLVSALALLWGGPVPDAYVIRWLQSEASTMNFGFLMDGPNLLMGVVVALIALGVQIYSIGYMAGDRGFSRYFAMMGLFAWSMLSFVYSANLLQMFIFWELVGLASFFLIGFWYEKPEAAAAARKAFVMTRIGDVGLFIGLILLYHATGTLDIQQINNPATLAAIDPQRLALIAVLFFCGVVGKSAQFPLHTWLPDAMEGPTPVSALLHSATMVAAGVFLFARFHGLFLADAQVVTLVLGIAMFTAILSATVAMVQFDIKRVLAYSSISQLAFMLLGLGAGSLHAGLFHLTTHAFFKALLFLCAGVYIHHIGSNDMVVIGRAGGRKLRWVTAGLIVGGASLAGLPPFSGFFSKEAILAAVGATAGPYMLGLAYLASFMTAYYTFRMVFLIIRPNPEAKVGPEQDAGAAPGHGHGHGHGDHGGGGASMLPPIIVLTALAAAAGFGSDYVAKLIGAEAMHPSGREMGIAISVAAAGLLLAWFEFGRKGASQVGFINRVPALQTLFERKWYIDEFYSAVVGGLMSLVSGLCALVEVKALDGLTDGVARTTIAGGQGARVAQGGRLQFYIAVSVLFLAVAGYLLG